MITIRSGLRRIGLIGLGLVVASYSLMPFYWILLSAVRPPSELLEIPPSWLPGSLSLDNFAEVWSSIPLAHYMLNSVIVALMATVLSVLASCLAAYGLVRYPIRGSGAILVAILFTLTIPTVICLVPFYQILTSFGLLNTRFGLALSFTVWAVPFTTLLLRGYFQSSYPVDVEEAALIDGCSRVSVLWRIMLPLSLPGLLAASVFTFLLSWNEYVWASVITSDEESRTASVGLQSFVGQFANNVNLGEWMAGAFFLTVPVAICFMLVQRHLTSAYSGVGK